MNNTTYKIIDTQTGQQIGKDYSYNQRNRARNRADKLDIDYGLHRYCVKVIFDKEV